MRRTVSSVLVLLVSALGCDGSGSGGAAGGGSGGGAGAGGDGGGGAGGAPPFEVVLDWQPCPLDSKKSSGSDAECANVVVPADWEDSSGPTLTVFVKRWPVLATPADHHIWLVQGGPGFSGVEWDTKALGASMAFPAAQIYFQDPRGTGRSTRLGCPDEEDPQSDEGWHVSDAEWPSCLATVQATHGDLLPFFTTTQTAKDLGALIEAASGAASKRSVVGQSYGTTLVQRWLHFFPDQATEVILDSLANPGSTFTQFSERTDGVGHDYLALCAMDALCLSKLGPDPVQTAENAVTGLETGACPALLAAGLDREALARDLYGLLTLVGYRAMIPPVFHRLARCNAEDVAVLTQFASLFGPSPTPDIVDELFSTVLHHHVILSEMWDANPPTAAAHLTALQELEFGLIDVELDQLLPTWPVYAADAFAAAYPTTSVPLLMLNGTLDAQTPLEPAEDAIPHYTAASQYFVVVPGSPHGALGGEPWSQPTFPCSIQIANAFVADSSQTPDESCFALADPVDFEPDAATTQLFFGIADPWGDGGPAPPPPLPPSVMEKKRAELRAELARAILR